MRYKVGFKLLFTYAFFTDTLTGYAVGEGGVIVKYKYEIPDNIASENNFVPSDFILNQNFPNPFNSSTTIRFSISEPANVSIKIFNVLGIQTTTLVDEFKSVGPFEVVWNGDNESSGVYYVQMNVEGKISTKKMVLLK